MSFAPLAGRLAAHAAELRPVEGARDNLAKFMALVMCAVLDMLILVCEMLDARAAMGVRAVAAPAPRDHKAACVPAGRSGCEALPGKRRASSPSLVLEVRAAVRERADPKARITDAHPAGPWLAWSRDPGPLRATPVSWRPRRKTRLFALGTSTPLSLRLRNDKGVLKGWATPSAILVETSGDARVGRVIHRSHER